MKIRRRTNLAHPDVVLPPFADETGRIGPKMLETVAVVLGFSGMCSYIAGAAEAIREQLMERLGR